MPVIHIVTGSAGKAASFRRLIPASIQFKVVDIDLSEIQSFDAKAIITDKVQRAYAVIGKPILVEDVSAGLYALGGLPGPFIKFFEERLGKDALYQLAKGRDSTATITSTIGYYDGVKLTIVEGQVEGNVVAARGENGFGFDCCFVAHGQTKTFAEMTDAEKDSVSHRSQSVKAFLGELKKL